MLWFQITGQGCVLICCGFELSQLFVFACAPTCWFVVLLHDVVTCCYYVYGCCVCLLVIMSRLLNCVKCFVNRCVLISSVCLLFVLCVCVGCLF